MIGSQTATKDDNKVEPATRLARHIFGESRGIMALFTATRTGDRLEDRRTVFHSYPDQLDAAFSWALDESERGREAYFCAHLLTDRKRVKANAAPVSTLWGDLDGEDIPTGELEPSAVVESSPGRFHCYWRLMDEIPPEQAEDLNRRLARKIGADPSGFDLSQLLRIPGSVNHKRDETTAVELRYVGERRYTAEALDELLPPAETPEKPRRAAPSGPGTAPVRLEGRAREVWNGDHPRIKEGRIDRNASLLKIGRVLYDADAERPVIVEALRERDTALGYRKFADRTDAEQRYHEIVDELERNGRNTRARLTAVAGGAREPSGSESEPEPAFSLTDLGNAERLARRFGDRIRYCEKWRTWIVSDGMVWRTGAEMAVAKMAHQVARGIHAEAADEPDKDRQRAIAKWALASQNDTRLRAMIAQARPYVGIEPNELDADPLLLNCSNGTVDLRTGELREHSRGDYITKMAGTRYDPEAEAPRFERFLREVLIGDELISFVRRFAGYTLTGLTRERVFAMLHGRGKNGKSTLVELLIEVMGDYATPTDVETILAKRYQGVGNDVAALKGARLVATSEVERGRALAESKVKQLTGSDTVTARFLYGEPFSFRPEFKLWLSTNNRPDVHGTDDAIWDRIRLIPFTQRFEGDTADLELPDKLRGELPGILALMVRGCIEWQRIGLGEPNEVVAATDSYREDMDTLGAFIDERCILHPSAEVKATPLYDAYKEWCERSTEHAESQRRFGMRLTERGLERKKVGGVYRWYGIGLLHPAPGPSAGSFGPDHGDAPHPDTRNGPDSPPSRTNGPDAENRIPAGDSRTHPQQAGPSGPNIHNSRLDSPHEEDSSENGPNGPEGPDGVENQGAGESWY